MPSSLHGTWSLVGKTNRRWLPRIPTCVFRAIADMCQSLLHTWAPGSIGVKGTFPEGGPLNYELEDEGTALKGTVNGSCPCKRANTGEGNVLKNPEDRGFRNYRGKAKRWTRATSQRNYLEDLGRSAKDRQGRIEL